MAKAFSTVRRVALCGARWTLAAWIAPAGLLAAAQIPRDGEVRTAAYESWLQLDPQDYGTQVLGGDPNSSPVIKLSEVGAMSRLADLPPLRGEPPEPGSPEEAKRPTSFIERTSFVGQPLGSLGLDDELDNRQALTLNGPFEDIAKALAQELDKITVSLGAEPGEEWAKRTQLGRERLAEARTLWGDAQEKAARTRAAPQHLDELHRTLAQGQALIVAPPAPQTPAEGQTLLTAARQALQQQKLDLDQAQNALSQRGQTKADLEAELAALRQRLAEFALLPPGTDESPDAAMKRWESRAELLGLRVKLLLCEQRMVYHEATAEVDQASRDVLQRQITEQQTLVEALEQQANELRRSEVQQQAEQAEREAAKVNARARSLAVVAENNSQLVTKRAELAQKIESLANEIKSVNESAEKIKQTRARLEEKISKAGMNQTIGTLMLVHRRELPNLSAIARRNKQIGRETPDIQLTRIELEDRRDEIADVASVVAATLQQLAQADQVEITPEIRSAVEELLTTRRQLIQDLIQDVDRYVDELAQFDNASHGLMQQTRESQNFVDKHVLWIRSTEPLNRTDIGNVVSAFVSVSRSLQPEVANFDWRLATRRWSQFAIWGLLLLLVGIATRKRLKTTLHSVSESVARSPARRLAVVLQMVLLMLLVAAFWPAIYWGLGKYLSSDAFDIRSVGGSLGQALVAVVPFVALACVMRQLTLRDGFAEKYMGWQAATIGAVHRATGWYLVTVLPLRAAGVFFDHFQEGRWAASAGRMMFILSQIALFICLNTAIRHVSAAILSMGQPGERGFWLRTRRIWCSAIVLAPLLLAGLSMVGYHYSASELSYRFGWTVWLIFGAMAAVSLAQQIVQIILNKISVRRFWLDRAQENDQAAGEPNEEFDGEKIGHQIGRLLRGLTFAGVVLSAFLIWSQVLPAIQIIDQVEIWSVQRHVVENQLNAEGKPLLASDGTPITQSVTKVQRITLADLGWAAICLALTVIVSRNLPGLLEVTLLDRLPLDRGGKYAISVVCRYFVAIAGCILAARCLGFEWSSVQWLVAAMSVGLGFGLQEIFGNFVSGMIILLERPIRVGDLVTVNGTTGYVTRIQLRATTITDADRREMIVPNKKFITDDVINWTLTDSVTRLVIPVGIAYGSDTDLACATLLEVARRNPHVMNDPEPNVVFTRFGASSLDLELRVYLPNREHFPDVQHELHLAIDREFRQKHIEIAFPQQEIHIRPSDAMAKALLHARQEVKQQSRKNDAA